MNPNDRSGWGTICSVLVALAVAFVPLIWKMQQMDESRQALEQIQRNSAAGQKARDEAFRQQREEKGRRHDLDLRYDQRKRDPRFVPLHEQHGQVPSR